MKSTARDPCLAWPIALCVPHERKKGGSLSGNSLNITIWVQGPPSIGSNTLLAYRPGWEPYQ